MVVYSKAATNEVRERLRVEKNDQVGRSWTCEKAICRILE